MTVGCAVDDDWMWSSSTALDGSDLASTLAPCHPAQWKWELSSAFASPVGVNGIESGSEAADVRYRAVPVAVSPELGSVGFSTSEGIDGSGVGSVGLSPSAFLLEKARASQPGKIFVGGLSWETNELSMRSYFEQFGKISECVIMRDRATGHPRGFGFVTYVDGAVADRVAIEKHELDGRPVEAKLALPRSECPGPSKTGGAKTSKKVFVGGLPSSCSQSELCRYFQNFGQVVESLVMYDHQTGNSRGFGFVTFNDTLAVDRVTEVETHKILGKFVEVKRAEPRQVIESRKSKSSGTSLPASLSPLSALEGRTAILSDDFPQREAEKGIGFGLAALGIDPVVDGWPGPAQQILINSANWHRLPPAIDGSRSRASGSRTRPKQAPIGSPIGDPPGSLMGRVHNSPQWRDRYRPFD